MLDHSVSCVLEVMIISSSSMLDIVRAAKWSQVWCTSYALSLSFFEAVVLNELTADAAPACTLLVDSEGVRSALQELGPQHAGRLYDVEPMVVDTGCFHPKIILLANETEAHLLVGSSNLSFSGWGRNLECFDHLHASFASNALQDMSAFFRALSSPSRVRHLAQVACQHAAEVLERHAIEGRNSVDVRVLHNINVPLIEQFTDIASSLGGATRLIIASPYYDQFAVYDMCKRLGVPGALLHSHVGGTVEGQAANWPINSASIVNAITLDWLDHANDRPLHAKLFEITCANGRFVVSGSANCTRAALLDRGNVEVCVVRVERDRSAGWSYRPAQPPIQPEVRVEDDSDEKNAEQVRILTGKIEGVSVRGRILESFPVGVADAGLRAGSLWAPCGLVSLSPSGEFSFVLPNQVSWVGGQVVLRIVSAGGTQAIGFLSQPEFGSVARRLGRSARSFLAFLQGMGVPDDMSAVLQYFQQHPEDLLLPEATPTQGGVHKPVQRSDTLLPVREQHDSKQQEGQGNAGSAQGDGAWARLVDDLIIALTNPHRNLSQSEDDDESEDDEPRKVRDKRKAADSAARQKLVKDVPYLISRVEKADPERVNLSLILALLNHAAPVLLAGPAQLNSLFARVMGVAARRTVWVGNQSLVVVAYLLYGCALRSTRDFGVVYALRRLLIRCGSSLDKDSIPDVASLKGLADSLVKSIKPADFWEEVCAARIPQEDALVYVKASGAASAERYVALCHSPAWRELKIGMHSRIHTYSQLPKACRHCNRMLASRDRDQLRQYAAITHLCGYTLLCTEV